MPVTLNDMTADRLNSVEPQRGHNGKIHILGLSTFGGSDTFGDDVLVLGVQSFPLPKLNSSTLELNYLNETRKFAGKSTVEPLSITYKDLITVSASVYEVLWNWRQAVQSITTGAIGFQSEYKKNAYCVMFDSKGQTPNQRTWPLYGVWPSALDPGDVDQDDDSYVRCTITLEIDKFDFSPSAAIPSAWAANSYP